MNLDVAEISVCVCVCVCGGDESNVLQSMLILMSGDCINSVLKVLVRP